MATSDRNVIKAIQTAIGSTADGIWGPNTQKAVADKLGCSNSVKGIQVAVNVQADGIIGPNTLKAISKQLGLATQTHKGSIFLDPGHTSDYEREHPSQFKKTDWTAGKPKEILSILQFNNTSEDSLEHRLNLFICYAVQRHLSSRGFDVTLYDNPSLSNSAEIRQVYTRSNALSPDAFVSIHNNAQGGSSWQALGGSASGTVGLYHIKSNMNKILAKTITDKVNKLRKESNGPNNRASTLMTSTVGVLSNAKSSIPAALIEIGFYDNLNDLYWMVTHLDQIGKVIADGIEEAIA